MIACGHERAPLGEPFCTHIRNCGTPRFKIPWFESVKWLIGDALKAEILCVPLEGSERMIS